MKKIFSLLLALTMVVGLLAGCGSANVQPNQPAQPSTSQSSAPSSEPSQTPEAVGEPVYIASNASSLKGKVRFYTAFAGENGTDALIQEFNKHYPNVTVESTVYKNSADGNLGLDTAMMAGEVDVILSFGVANTAKRWSSNLLMDMTDRMKADNLDLKKEWGTDAYKYNDRAYVFPSGGLSVFVAINLDKWNAAGLGKIPTSWTWDEYVEASRKMTERDASGKTVVYGGSDFNQIDYWTYSIRQSKGLNAFYKADGTSDFDNPLWKKVLQREVDAEKEGIWHSKANYLADSTKSRDKVINGEVASSVESIITRYITGIDLGFKMAYAPYPTNEKGETNYMAGAIPNSFVAVASNTPNPDASYAFAKFAATYGNKYMYAAGHAATWTGLNPEEVLEVVFGSREAAEKKIDVDSYISNVIGVGQPAYSEDYIVAFTEIQSLIDEYSQYVLTGELTVDAALAEMKKLADQAIKEAQ